MTESATSLCVLINRVPHTLPAGAVLADAVAAAAPKGPFAAAINLQFVPRARYGAHALHDGDQIELISPVTGG